MPKILKLYNNKIIQKFFLVKFIKFSFSQILFVLFLYIFKHNITF